MNRLARWMIRLYPASWRARYADEMEALLSDTGADARTVGDLARGGVRMQLKAWPFPLLALVLGFAGLLVGAGTSFLMPNIYASHAMLRTRGAQSTRLAIEEIMHLKSAVMTRASLARIINGVGLYPDQLRVTPLEDVIEKMRRDIHADVATSSKHRGAAALNIRFEYGDRLKAQRAVAALVTAFGKEFAAYGGQSGEQHPGKLMVVDIGNLPAHPVSPTKFMLLAGGFLAGLLIAVLLRILVKGGWFRRRFAAAAIMMGVAGVVFAFYAEAVDLGLWANRYRSTATFLLGTARPSQVDAITSEVLAPDSLSTIAQDPRLRLYKADIETKPIEDVIRVMREHIAVSKHSYSDGASISIAFDYCDRYKAVQTVQILLGKFRDVANRRLALPAETVAPLMDIDILDQPSLPGNPVKPNRHLIAGMGGIGGLLLAAIISLVRRRWKPVDSIVA